MITPELSSACQSESWSHQSLGRPDAGTMAWCLGQLLQPEAQPAVSSQDGVLEEGLWQG